MEPKESLLGSIERKVAFIVTPVLTVLAGLVTQVASTGQLASTHAPGGSYALSGLSAAGVAAACWKWLEGRSEFVNLEKEASRWAKPLEPAVMGALKLPEMSLSPDDRAKIITEIESLLTNKGIVTDADIADINHIYTVLRRDIAQFRQELKPDSGAVVTKVTGMDPAAVTTSQAQTSGVPTNNPADWTSPGDPAPPGDPTVAPDASSQPNS